MTIDLITASSPKSGNKLLADVQADAVERLRKAGVVSPARDVRRLLAHAIGCDEAGLLGAGPVVLTAEQEDRFESALRRRVRREPVSRILGRRAFYDAELWVTPDVLDPRADTETIIRLVESYFGPDLWWRPPARVLDLGTGSGALLIALLQLFPMALGVGVDMSTPALRDARRNAIHNGVASRAHFAASNWLDALGANFDLIVSNPPYIRSAEVASLEPEVRNHDPRNALDGGADGLDAYRALLPQLRNNLTATGVAIVEVGYGQWKNVADLAGQAGLQVVLGDSKDSYDLAGVQRCIALRSSA